MSRRCLEEVLLQVEDCQPLVQLVEFFQPPNDDLTNEDPYDSCFATMRLRQQEVDQKEFSVGFSLTRGGFWLRSGEAGDVVYESLMSLVMNMPCGAEGSGEDIMMSALASALAKGATDADNRRNDDSSEQLV